MTGRRILMVCPQFRPLIGGYERAAERLSIALVARGHRVDVVTERRDRSWPRHEALEGVGIRRIASVHARGIHSLSVTASLTADLLAYARGYDVLHVHQYGWLAGAAVACGRLLGRPVILKLTNTEHDGIDGMLPTGPAGQILRALHRRVSGCVATSDRAATEAIAFGIPKERIFRMEEQEEEEEKEEERNKESSQNNN